VLYDMYLRYAAMKKWKVEVLSEDASDKDGINEAVFVVKGPDAYIRLEHEAGTHRVQRVPVTEAKGRIHTSTATVTVLPEADEVEIAIDPNDLKIDVYRSTGPGGQSVNTTDSAVRITHLPTGTVVAMQDEKSQIQNRAKAMVVLRARLLKAEQDRQAAEMSAQRRGQVGAGSRTDKIRTYNFKENRVTDHRINLTLYKLDQVLAGDLSELTDALMADKRARQLAGEEDGAG
jgi:peptide chain release factor 1